MLKSLTPDQAEFTAKLHHSTLENDFLPGFGLVFLRILHFHLLNSKYCYATGYFIDQKLIGFIVGTQDKHFLFRAITSSAFFQLLPVIFLKIIRSPRTLIFLIQTIFYTSKFKGLPAAELLIIAVEKKYQNQGFGTLLLKKFKQTLISNNIKIFHVDTHVNNGIANRFYKKNGGKLNGTFILYNKVWNTYVFQL